MTISYRFSLFLIFFTLCFNVFAAKSKIDLNDLKQSSIDLLNLPNANRKIIFQEKKPNVKTLESIAFDKTQSLETRWRAITSLIYTDFKEAEPVLLKAFKSNEWFIRNSALIAATRLNRNFALQWAEVLLSDPSLIVRTAAVQCIGELKAEHLNKLLWQKLYTSENFRRNESLWVRRYIVESLAVNAKVEDQSRFIEVLNDKDINLYRPAILALEKITQKKLGEPGDTLASHKEKWLEWWNVKNQTSIR